MAVYFQGPAGSRAWRVEYFDADGGCYVTVFAGPAAEKRARDYFKFRTQRQSQTREMARYR
jgi:hypothetical protein